MITSGERNRLVRAVNRLLNAEEADSWSGAGRPEDIPRIRLELVRARAGFEKVLEDITEPPKQP